MAECKYCGEEMPKAKGRGKTKLYCSDEHRNLAQEQKEKFPLHACRVAGCEKLANRVGPGLCEMHYARARRNGTTDSQYERMAEFNKQSGGYLYVKAKGHALSGLRTRAYAHRVAFYDANGEGPFACHWCKAEVNWATMHVDHLDDDKGNNLPSNLVAACPVCNMQRGHHKVMQSHRDKTGIEFAGEKLTIAEWAKKIGISRPALVFRLEKGWPLERALTEGRGATGPAAKG